MTMTEDQFFQELRQGLKNKKIIPYLEPWGRRKLVRFKITDAPCSNFCPITAVEYLVTGTAHTMDRWQESAVLLGLASGIRGMVVSAADATTIFNGAPADKARVKMLRRKLMKLVRETVAQ